jgi:Salmonella virulence plasmid 65kDa B protein
MDPDDLRRPPFDGRALESLSPKSPPQADSQTQTKEQAAGKRRNADVLPSVSLPKSGGAIRGLGEKVSINAANGTAGMSLPLPLSSGRSGFTPALRLSYDSASGNGIFGFGWSLDTPAITRKTDKRLPQYCDSDESDVFILSGAEDLVPILDATGARKTQVRTVYGTNFKIAYYRPRIEGTFAGIERWVAADTGLTHWRSISRDNVSTLYGYDAASRVANPADATQTFSWNISRSWDDKGNVVVYSYANEDSAGLTQFPAHEANRTPATRAAQTYLTTIQYGNTTPYFPKWDAASEVPPPSNWMFSVVLDYGNHTAAPPTPQPDQPWPLRPDPFSSYRSGFEVRTYRRVQRVLMFNNFPNETTAGAVRLVRSLDLICSDQQKRGRRVLVEVQQSICY